MRETIHFAHGNGFPSSCYRQLLNELTPHVDCCFIDKIGHNSDYPVTDNWAYLVQEVIHSIKTQASQPVIAVGHSLGGVLSFLAAIEQPQLFKAVVMLDSPLMGRFKSHLIRLSKLMGAIDSVTPAKRTHGRRNHWADRDAVLSYLRSRSLFKHFTDACLNDYIDYGLQKDAAGGYSLRFDNEIEYQIFRTIPHSLYKFEDKLRVPTYLIYGNKTSVVDRFDLRYMKHQYGVKQYQMNGTHMFPMEYPEETAALILKIIT